jgi:HAD superfamily hydrolase (TIGR01509 family)
MKIILVDAVDCFVSAEGKIFQEMKNLLDTYPNRKIILTGANDDKFAKYGLDKVPYEVFTLRHNPEKTDPKYYETVLSHFNLTKEEAIYFEHNPAAVSSAQSVGISTYFYDNEKKDLGELKKFLDAHIS